MAILPIVEAVLGVVGKAVKDPAEMARIANEARVIAQEGERLNAEREKARFSMLGGMFTNKSWFVSGAIPAWIWLVPVHVAVTQWIMPVISAFGFHVPIPTEMPAGVVPASVAIVGALLGKKVVDDNEWRGKDGALRSPAKAAVKLETAVKAQADVDARLADLAKRYGGKSGD